MKLLPELQDLAARLRNKPPPPTTLNWELWLEIVQAERIGPYLHRRASDNLPESVRDELRQSYIRESRDAFLRAAEMYRVFHLLNSHVEFVVLKGAAVADSLYADLSERPMWDVDLLVAGASDRDFATRLLADAGMITGKDLETHHHAPALRDQEIGFGVEVHTNLVTPPLPDGLMKELWARRKAGPRFTTLDPVGMVIHHAIHAFNDPTKSPLFRNLFETARLAEKLAPGEIAALQELAQQWRLTERLGRALGLAHELFGSPQIIAPPRRSFIERWIEQRLRWYGELNLATRIARHLAHEQIRKIHRGASAQSWLPLLQCAGEFVIQSTLEHTRHLREPPRRAPGHAVRVGPCSLLQNERTGAVHLLNAEATAALETMRGPHQVLRALRRSGVLD